MSDNDAKLLPDWAPPLLREAPASSAASRDAIMQRVRGLPAPRALAPRIASSRWRRRGILTPAGSAFVTLVFMITMVLRVDRTDTALDASAYIVGDTIVPRLVTRGGAGALHDTLYDTLRIVNFMLRGPGVSSAMVASERDGTTRANIRLVRSASNEWSVRTAVPRDALHFTYIVNGERVIHVRALPASRHSSI